MRLLDTRTCA